MSSSSNLRTPDRASYSRRRLLGALCGVGALTLLPFATARANVAAPLAGFRRWGSGEFRRFGFLIYEATLWVGGDDPQRPPLALQLTYKRNLVGKRIAEASVSEMRNLGIATAAQLERWGAQMENIFPDVRPGDAIVGIHRDGQALYFLNGSPIGEVNDAAFARAFFAIWLDPDTSAPALRTALLTRAGN